MRILMKEKTRGRRVADEREGTDRREMGDMR